MTKEEALLRLSVVPPRSESSRWTILMMEDDGTAWFILKDASFTSASQKYEVIKCGDSRAATVELLSFMDEYSADFVCEGWNDLADRKSVV